MSTDAISIPAGRDSVAEKADARTYLRIIREAILEFGPVALPSRESVPPPQRSNPVNEAAAIIDALRGIRTREVVQGLAGSVSLVITLTCAQ